MSVWSVSSPWFRGLWVFGMDGKRSFAFGDVLPPDVAERVGRQVA